ncbi:MAG TPA: hypothetical protein VL443_12715 [Cyclobacteriaceae bacterium]|jgi:hypothetical protein|nr:hypothetical protein [Cyclobacteriaceae bacterium]
MKRTNSILINLLILAYLSISCTQRNVDYRELYGLKGNVKHVTSVSIYEPSESSLFDLFNTVIDTKEVMTFNQQGQLIAREEYILNAKDKSFKMESHSDYMYDNELLKFQVSIDDQTKEETRLEITNYNEKGFPIRIIEVGGDIITDITYSNNGRHINTITKNGERTTSVLSEVVDKNMNLISRQIEFKDNLDARKLVTQTYQYTEFDNHDNWVKRTIIEKESQIKINEERLIVYY